MKRKVFRDLAVVLAVVMVLGVLAACGGNKGAKEPGSTSGQATKSQTATETIKPKPEPVELQVMLFGDKPNGMDEVLAEFEKRTADTLNTKLNIIWTPLGDYANKLKLKLSAGEEVDCNFDAQWLQLLNYIGQNNYLEMDKYFVDDNYPGLKKSFSTEMLNNNKFNGDIYGVPFSQGYGEVNGIYIRKDLREKYGLPEIETINDLEAFYDKVKENEPGMMPIAENAAGTQWMLGFSQYAEVVGAQDNVYGTGLGADISASFTLSADKKHVDSVLFSFETGAPTNPQVIDVNAVARKWYTKGYFEKDVISQKDKVGVFKAGKAASMAWDTANFYNVSSDLKKSVPGAQLELFVSNEAARNLQPGSMMSEFKAWNFACIPVSSKKADRTMQFFSWLFNDKANHDLFEYGIEGKNWDADGEDKYKVSDGYTSLNFPGYEFTWNTNYVRYPFDMDETVLKYLKYRSRDDSYIKSELSGFAFNQEPVKTEMAKVGPCFTDINTALCLGVLDNYQERMAQAVEKAKKLGLDKIREEAKRQVEEFLAKK